MAVRHASSGLASRIEAICAGSPATDRDVLRAALSACRYLLRATGRPTPFGLFAGVTAVSVGDDARACLGHNHRVVIRADTEWLADVIAQLEACGDLLDRLNVVFSNLATRRGGRMEAPRGPGTVTVRCGGPVLLAREAASIPIRFGVLAGRLAAALPGADELAIRRMLTGLVREGFLITCLHAPMTVTDPLALLVGRLREAGAAYVPQAAPILAALEAITTAIAGHNHRATPGLPRPEARQALADAMRRLSRAGRTPVAADLLLDCQVQLPRHVAREMEQAAGALLRLTRQPSADPAWRHYHAAFCDRYGTRTAVPVTEVLDPDTGLGYPAGYPGSLFPRPADALADRDARLLALAWQALGAGSSEIVLTSKTIGDVAGDGGSGQPVVIPPHVELAARVYAASTQALRDGQYTLSVAPARAAGTLTSRFTPAATGSGLERAYAGLPTCIAGALSAQLSFPPLYPHAENVSRVPAYLPHVLPLGEHRSSQPPAVVAVDDLAVTATHDRLLLVTLSGRQVVEPQVFHALALDKQPAPLARFLAGLPRAFCARWHEFDWGPHTRDLPYLPRVRYGRAILASARWRLTRDDLPGDAASQDAWRGALARWRQQWRCPDLAELRDDDRTLRVRFTEPAHAAVLRAHLRRRGYAVLTETPSEADLGWIGGHAHEIAMPLVTTRSASPAPPMASLLIVTNADAELPASAGSGCVYAKIYSRPDRHDEIIAAHFPALLASLDGCPCWWFVRYRSPQEADHIRLRIRLPGDGSAAPVMAAIGQWAGRLHASGLTGRLAFDSYWPETGRYGTGPAMRAAEEVFAADSRAVASGLRRLPASRLHPVALAAISMVSIVGGFLGGHAAAMGWLAKPTAPAPPADRDAARQAIAGAGALAPGGLPGWPPSVAAAWHDRWHALAAYRRALPAPDFDDVLESLLHMHSNRAFGIDPDTERTCRRLARRAALSWQACRNPLAAP